MAKVTLPGGQSFEGQEENFRPVREDWNEYETASGVKVRIKVTALKIFRILDAQGRPAFTPDGDPNVIVRHNIQIVASGGPSRDDTETTEVH